MTNTKQIKITKLFRKGARAQQPEDCDDIEEEIQQLEQKLKEKQNELFQLQRNCCRRKCPAVKNKADNFIRPQKILLNNSVESLKGNIELMYMLSGIEVQSFVNDHCCIVYHMQHDTGHILKHGLRIDIKSDSKTISKSAMPLGFNLSAVLKEFDNIMTPICLGAIRKALVAYYDRLEQFAALKKLFNLEVQLFKVLDGSHIEICFLAQNDMEEDDVNVVLMLDYRVYDIRPKTFSFKEIDLPEGAAEALRAQCSVFKKQPLTRAFKDAFINGVGPYKLSRQMASKDTESQPRHRRRYRQPKQQYNNDDTFHPEECSEPSDEDEDEN